MFGGWIRDRNEDGDGPRIFNILIKCLWYISKLGIGILGGNDKSFHE